MRLSNRTQTIADYDFFSFSGKPLDDGLTFEAAGIREGSTVLVYPKMNQQRSVGDKQEIRKKIVKAITRLYKSKYLYMLGQFFEIFMCAGHPSLHHVYLSPFFRSQRRLSS